MQLQLKPPKNSFRYVDLFAGAGGLSLGLGWAGMRGVFAIEKCPMAFETFSKNLISSDSPYSHFQEWPDWLPCTHHFVDTLLSDELFIKRLSRLRGKVDLVAGGPPCQGFSVGGRRDSSDPRNALVYNFLQFVEILEPKYVLMENVLGITRRFEAKADAKNGEKRSTADDLVSELRRLNYSADWIIVKATDYGVPQTRERVLILGVKTKGNKPIPRLKQVFGELLSDAGKSQLLELGLPSDRLITIWEAMHDLAAPASVPCPDSPKYQSAKYFSAESNFAKLMRQGARTGSIPNSHRFSIHGEKVLALYKKAHATQKPGRLSKEFLLSNNTKTDKKVLLNPDLPSTTLTTHPDEQIHYLFPRNVTLREMARIQTFPDNFWFFGRYTLNGPRRKLDVSRCAQIGNAVPPLMARSIGIALHKLDMMLSAGTWMDKSAVQHGDNFHLFDL